MAGGSQIVISDDGITISTGGKILYQAGQHKFESGKKVKTEIPFLPEGTTENLKFHFADDDGTPYRNTPYVAVYPNGSKIKGVTDNEGFTTTMFSSDEKDIQVYLELDE